MKVSKHGVAVPTSNYVDLVWVNSTEQECHCTATMEQSSSNIGRVDTSITQDCKGGRVEKTCDHGRGNGFATVGEIKVHMKGTSWGGGGIMQVQVQDLTGNCTYRARKGLPIGSMGKFLAFDMVFLGGKGEGSVRKGFEAINLGGQRVGKVLLINIELGVGEPEGDARHWRILPVGGESKTPSPWWRCHRDHWIAGPGVWLEGGWSSALV